MDDRDVRREQVRWGLWIPLAIAVATVLAYLNTFANPFVFDDELIIVTNPELRSLFPVMIKARWVVNLTFAINYATGQLRVADYHATNLLIHLLAALVLYGVIRRTLLLPRAAGRWSPDAPVLAGVVAALWAVHPIQTQSVTYICQRYESLMGLCYLATLYAFIRGVQAAGGRHASAWYGLSVVICLLGMGTKETMVTAPLMLLLFDLVVVAPGAGELWRKRALVHLGLWVTLVVFVLLEWEMFQVVQQQGKGVTLAVSWHSYLLTQMQVIPHYLRLGLIPYPLCFDYAWPFVADWSTAAAPGAVLVVLGGLTAWLTVRRAPHAFIGLWFFGILAPTSSIAPVPDAAYEYRMYLPLAAVLSVVVLGGYRLLCRRSAFLRWGRVLVIAVGCILVVMGVAMTSFRNRVYASPLLLWEDVIRTRPENHRARLNLASALLAGGRQGRALEEAGVVVERLGYCRNLEAGEVPAWGATREEADRYRDVRHYAIAHNIMGVASIQQGEKAAAEAHFAEAVRLLPQYEDAARNLRQIRHTR